MKRTVRLKVNNCEMLFFVDKVAKVVAEKCGDAWNVDIYSVNDYSSFNRIEGVPEADKNKILAMFEEAGEK